MAQATTKTTQAPPWRRIMMPADVRALGNAGTHIASSIRANDAKRRSDARKRG